MDVLSMVHFCNCFTSLQELKAIIFMQGIATDRIGGPTPGWFCLKKMTGRIIKFRLYWYRDVTVLLPGWVIWKYMWFVHANLPNGRLTIVSALSISIGETGSIPLLTLTLTTITAMQLLHKQASRPLHVHTTMQLQSKITVYKCTRLNTIREIKITKRVAWATKYLRIIKFKKVHTLCRHCIIFCTIK